MLVVVNPTIEARNTHKQTGMYKGGAEAPLPARGPSPRLTTLEHWGLQLTDMLGEPSRAPCRRRPSMPAQVGPGNADTVSDAGKRGLWSRVKN